MKIFKFYIAVFLLIIHGVSGNAHDYKIGEIMIKHPWIAETPPGAQVAGGYLTIMNNSGQSDWLIGADAKMAGRSDIHQMSMEDGVMFMRPLKQGLEIPEGETISLKPGGYHIMFMQLKEQIRQNKRYKVDLIFKKAGRIQVEFIVEAMGSKQKYHSYH